MDRQEALKQADKYEIEALKLRLKLEELDQDACNQQGAGHTQTTSGLGRSRSRAEELDEMFTYHDNPSAAPHYVEIREAATTFAKVIERHAPNCADRTSAIRAVRQAVMWANAAIALNGLV